MVSVLSYPSSTSEKITTALGWLLKVALGAVWLFAGATKLGDPAGFAEEIGNYQLLTDVAPLLAVTLPVIELLVGAALVALPLPNPWLHAAALASGMLMVTFTVAVTSVLIRGIDIDCGCFGGGSGPVTPLTVVRDLTLMALSVAVLALAWRKARPERI